MKDRNLAQAPRRAPLDVRGLLDEIALATLPAPVTRGLTQGHRTLKNYVPDIPKPPLAAAVTPVVGSAWQAGEDLQDGRYLPAMMNGGLAVLDALTLGEASVGIGSARAIANELGTRAMTGKNAQQAARRAAGVEGRGWEAHHTIALKGRDREKLENWRNHPVFMKVLPTATHRRLHGSYKGQKPFGPLEKAWYGTTGLMKAGAAGVGGLIIDSTQNLIRDEPTHPSQDR